MDQEEKQLLLSLLERSNRQMDMLVNLATASAKLDEAIQLLLDGGKKQLYVLRDMLVGDNKLAEVMVDLVDQVTTLNRSWQIAKISTAEILPDATREQAYADACTAVQALSLEEFKAKQAKQAKRDPKD